MSIRPNTNKSRWSRGTLRHLAARTKGRTIGLYGGSFNPAHAGHRHLANEAIKRLGLDEVWFLVSPGNPLKPTADMAPFAERKKSLEAIIKHHPKMTAHDFEGQLGTRYTIDTVTALLYELPSTKFVWLMGADNFSNFERWHRWQDIAKALPIAIFARTGYGLNGFASGLARQFSQYRVSPEHFNANRKPHWTYVTMPRHPASASEYRLQHGENWFLE